MESPGAHRTADGVVPWPELQQCEALLAQQLDVVVRRLGRKALGLVALPPLSDTVVEPAHLRVAAVLLWAREVEAAGLPAFVEALAAGVVRGQLILPIGASASQLMRYWRGRHERFAREEREELYSRLFGGPGSTTPNSSFEQDMSALVGPLDEVGRMPVDHGITHLEARVGVIGRSLAGTLSARSVGMAAFAARDIVAHIRETLRLLRDAELRRALGGRDLWTTISLHGPGLLKREVHPSWHITRARAGLTILSWLASVGPRLGTTGVRLQRRAPVVQAAAQWRAMGDAP